jgi:cytochrome P450
MAVAAAVMGLPGADSGSLLRLSYASLAPRDPRYAIDATGDSGFIAHCKIMEYFYARVVERRAQPGDDLISHLLLMTVDGRPLTDQEVVLNCLSFLLGALVTTSHVISATLIGLAEQHGGDGRWPNAIHVESLIEEGLRWSSPVTHFMRHARRDTQIAGTPIMAGDAVAAWIASANRDEDVFDEPYLLDAKRSPNRHLAFGAGAHMCVGNHYARLMLSVAFAELIDRIEGFEIADTIDHLVSNEIAGVVSMPLRVTLRALARRGIAETS